MYYYKFFLMVNTQRKQYVYRTMGCNLERGVQLYYLPSPWTYKFNIYFEFTGIITGLKIHFKRKS